MEQQLHKIAGGTGSNKYEAWSRIDGFYTILSGLQVVCNQEQYKHNDWYYGQLETETQCY